MTQVQVVALQFSRRMLRNGVLPRHAMLCFVGFEQSKVEQHTVAWLCSGGLVDEFEYHHHQIINACLYLPKHVQTKTIQGAYRVCMKFGPRLEAATGGSFCFVFFYTWGYVACGALLYAVVSVRVGISIYRSSRSFCAFYAGLPAVVAVSRVRR